MLQAIVFDFDGVVLDSVDVKTKAFEAMYLPYGETIAQEVVKHHLAHGGVSRFEKFKHYHGTFLGREIYQEELDALCQEFNEKVFQKVLAADFLPGVQEFIRHQYAQRPLYICTGTPESEILQITEALGIQQFFKGIYGSPATKIEIIQRLLDSRDYQPEHMLFLGDAMTDYEAARHHGLQFTGVVYHSNPFPPGTHVIPDFSNYQPAA